MSVALDDIIVHEFYWIRIDPTPRNALVREDLILIVAQSWYCENDKCWRWEACGTDEGVEALAVIAHVPRPESLP